VIGLLLGGVIMFVILWLFRRMRPRKVDRVFRVGQLFSAAAYSIGHGGNDAQKTMGVITLALVTSGHQAKFDHIPTWVIVAAGIAIGLGTYVGGWRIMRTLGQRLYNMEPAAGFSAQTTAGVTIYLATKYGYPLSTTHVISGGVLGAGATKRLSAVRWGVAGNIVFAWLLTIPAAALIAAALYWPIEGIF